MLWVVGIILAILLAGIAAGLLWLRAQIDGKAEAPPRASDAIDVPQQVSAIDVPLDVQVSVLSRALEQAVPRTLWSINQQIDKCVPAQRLKLFKARLKVTPDLGCTVVGTVTRWGIRLHGQGDEIVADVPIRANIAARHVGGFLKGETATGSAMVQARIRLTMTEGWQPRATVRLAYSWTTAPGIDFLGKRITFTDKADEKLRPVVRDLERKLPQEIAKLNMRARVADAWRQSFTSLQLNEENPPVWMRITPQKLSYGGYRLSGNRLRLSLGLSALTETFVGPRPEDPKPTPLPPLGRDAAGSKLEFFIPVIADYAQLEPVLQKALDKRARRPFELPGVGPVLAHFENVTGYGTVGGRIAVGMTISARPQSGGAETHGLVWLTARPVNQPGSQKVAFADLAVSGQTDGIGGDLLVKLVQSPAISETLAESLTQNFAKDFDKLLGKVRRAIVSKRAGDFVIRADITDVRNGALKAAGQGVYLPVWASGTARVEYVGR
ncbi:DUF4403 family protein [Sphingomonas sp. HITSZ_GF]|uniref:DUF4403 family protein n=1 Tax=Sphingomonas sp. HITSZ_GF TaxID=3037247 RepID=UPI00240E742F|nr:DUF4403 family protein [Sphingomonas sp. HITSZ_GF]MDG2535639.1 DUF4403 family protein [Sphingomonas sp. HITSZ_GF]